MNNSHISIGENKLTTEEIKEGNKLIERLIGNDIDGDTVIFGSGQRMHISESRFHKSWDQLMPVVEKIEEFKGITVIVSNSCIEIYSYGSIVTKQSKHKKIENYFLAVMEFIKWRNTKKQ